MQEVFEKITEKLTSVRRVVKEDTDLEWNRAICKCEEIINQVAKEYADNGYEIFSREQLKAIEDMNIRTFNRIWKQKKDVGNNGWIPCSERLPEKDGNYIVTFDDGYVTSAPFINGDWELWCDSGEPVAWQPLPAPYRPDENIEQNPMQSSP